MHLPMTDKEALKRLDEQLDDPNCPCTAALAGNHLHLNIVKDKQKIWSPHLNLEVTGEDEGATIHGHFGPRPDIWTLVMAFYAISGFVTLMGLLFAVAQWSLDMPMWSLWIVAGGITLGIVVYLLALAGQALSHTQMESMLKYVQKASGSKETIHIH